jgi:hypothetical protein
MAGFILDLHIVDAKNLGVNSVIDVRTFFFDRHLLIDNDGTILQVWHKAVNEACIKVDCCPVCFERLDEALDKRKREFYCVISPVLTLVQ